MKFVLRVLIYIVGLFICSFGVALTVNAGLGVSPVTSLSFAISRIIGGGNPIPYLGTCVAASSCVLMLVQLAMLRGAYPIKNVLQFPFSLLMGVFIDACKVLLGSFTPPGRLGQLGLLGLGIVCIGLGLTLYLSAQLASMPDEGLGQILAEKLNRPYPQMKVITDCAFAAFAICLSLVAFGNIEGIGIGTIITALCIGRVLAFFSRFLAQPIGALCFGGGQPRPGAVHFNLTLAQAATLVQAKREKDAE